MRTTRLFSAFLLGTCFSLGVAALPVHEARAEAVIELPVADAALSAEQEAAMTAQLTGAMEATKSPGAVVLVLKDGKIVYEKAVGARDKTTDDAMEADDIFRIYSMTKPITSIAVMMLWEEGAFRLDDPIGKYLPELKDMKVARENADFTEIEELVEPARPMQIRDLLTHTSGLTYGTALTGKGTATQIAMDEAGFADFDFTNAEFTQRLAEVPLAFEPGTQWAYGVSTDVLGRLVEAVSGMSLGAFFEERIFTPLGMDDTGFYVPQDKHDRIAEPFDPETGEIPDGYLDVTAQPRLEAGGAGLVSTAQDYARFCQMVLNKGTLGDVRLLKESTVEMLGSNQLPREAMMVVEGDPIDTAYPPLAGGRIGFGYGFSVMLANSDQVPERKGSLSWGGYGGTGFVIDPVTNMVVIGMIQNIGGREKFNAVVKQAAYDIIAPQEAPAAAAQ